MFLRPLYDISESLNGAKHPFHTSKQIIDLKPAEQFTATLVPKSTDSHFII